MAALQNLYVLFSLVFLEIMVTNTAIARLFTFQNSCNYTVWPGTTSGNNATPLGGGGFSLPPGASVQLSAPAGWSGRFWARTGCCFDDSGNGHCTTGDCGGALRCTGSGEPPVSLAEFTLDGADGKDFYDVSLVDGYNVGIGARASGGSGDCRYAGCVADMNQGCPAELSVVDGSGEVVACRSACAAFNTPEYCCTGAHATPESCAPNVYSKMFKGACPSAYSYAYDDLTSTFTCTAPDYYITFCPAT